MTRGLGASVTTVALAALTSCVAACTASSPAPRDRTIQLTTVWTGSLWWQVGQALTAAYTRRVPHLIADATRSRGLEDTADALEQGRADLAIEDAETAYIAYSKGTKQDPKPHQHIRAMSVLFPTAVQIVVRGDAGISKVADLRGRRVDVGQRGTPVERAARLILQSHGLTYDAIKPVFGSKGGADALRSHIVDARFFYTPYPQETIREAAATGGAHLIPIDRGSLAAIQEEHHFLKSVIIPPGIYPHQDDQVLTVGMDVLLLCRQDLPERLVYDMTAALFDAVPELSAAHPAASAIDPDRGPTTAVPLHPGAARYYREREILK